MTEEQRTENRRQKTENGKQNSEYRISNVECRTLEEEQTELLRQNEDIETTVETVVEAVLFASDEPLSEARLANIVETSVKQVRQCIENLNGKYRTSNNAFRIEQIAGGYQMLTLSPYNYWLKKLLRARSDSKLSPAAVETLAIIAYKQPVMRADIEVVRGVATGEVIRTLCYKGLVKIVGRAEVLGRPMLYGTTKKFLEVFGLNTLKDLPKIEELKKPPA
ncbi:MAG: SMC-Scp complex subunit ScpB [Planctomycetota bacterium]